MLDQVEGCEPAFAGDVVEAIAWVARRAPVVLVADEPGLRSRPDPILSTLVVRLRPFEVRVPGLMERLEDVPAIAWAVADEGMRAEFERGAVRHLARQVCPRHEVAGLCNAIAMAIEDSEGWVTRDEMDRWAHGGMELFRDEQGG